MVEITIVLVLLVLGFSAGTIAERRHLARLDEREAGNSYFLITQLRSFPVSVSGNLPPQLVVAETVVASDYFKTFLANLRRLFGGEVRSYQSLLKRARRETTQRIVEEAQEMGYNAICNLRLETADVGGSTASKKGAAMVAILGSATAYQFEVPSE